MRCFFGLTLGFCGGLGASKSWYDTRKFVAVSVARYVYLHIYIDIYAIASAVIASLNI